MNEVSAIQEFNMFKKIHIIGGGTISYVRAHLALTAPAYGSTARALQKICGERFEAMETVLRLTKMAGGDIETNEDLERVLSCLVSQPDTKIIFMTAAVVDFEGTIVSPRGSSMGILPVRKDGMPIHSGKYEKRPPTDLKYPLIMQLRPYSKLLRKIREKRKDIFLIAFKTTVGATEDEQYKAGLKLCKEASCNLVLANDTKTRMNMIICPEEARYHVTSNRNEALRGLVDMTFHRSHLTFTRSTVVDGEPVSWCSEDVPESLRWVVDWCVERNAYKPFNGVTAGHFACKIGARTFLTSIRKTNFNTLSKNGLVKIITDGPDSVMAYGSKPSVGGQSQRIVFEDHPEYDCIVHFHCPIKEGSEVPIVSQREFECGSHECGQNTSNGLKRFGNLSAVYLDNHGPNIVFERNIDPFEVRTFIEENFDLNEKTGGYVS